MIGFWNSRWGTELPTSVVLVQWNLCSAERVPTKRNSRYTRLAYADDIDTLGRSAHEVQDVFTAIETEAYRLGLQINTGKTKYMVPSTSADSTNPNARRNGISRR